MTFAPVPPRSDHTVAYLTDVEGQWERFTSFIACCPHLSLVDEVLTIAPGVTFVFGGDAIDRGARGRAIVRMLVACKRRQPDQLVVLAGNRDINKMRLVTELAGAPPRHAPDDVRNGSRAALLRWIFQHTMGAAQAFELRKDELVAEGRAHHDEDVAQSYLDDLAPAGELTAYLGACQLAWRAGSTLFVHGGVAAEALTMVPGQPTTELGRFDVDAWIERLNAFYVEQQRAFVARARDRDGKRAWRAVIGYQAPRPGTRSNPGSVVYGRFGDADNNPTLPARDVVDALVRAGVRRVVVGHTPSGDVASVVRTAAPRAPFEVVIADNSRSRVAAACALTVRDEAVALTGRLVLDDGAERAVAATLPLDDRASPVGLRRADGSLVKAPVDESFHTFRYLPGYQFSQQLVSSAALGPLHEAGPHALDDDDGAG